MRNRRLPQLLLITGPQGVGKQRLALWVAQRLMCEGPPGEPCDACRQCRLVLGLVHPDVHWFMPVPRPKAMEPDKQIEEIEETIGEVLAERRKDPLHRAPDGLSGHFISTARLITRRAVLRPVEGRAKVFVIGSAERLVPQESSPEAANSLLKLFEEPADETYFILTAADAASVLPTIRSRAVRLRLGPLSDGEVRRFLVEWGGGMSPQEIDQKVTRAQGIIGAAIGDETESAKGNRAARALLVAATAKNTASWELAMKQLPFAARGDFTGILDAMADILGGAARGSEGRAGKDLEPLSALSRGKLVAAIERVGEAREMAQNNVNPQILLAALSQDLAEIL